MQPWSRLTKAFQRNLGLKYEEPTPEMYAEVDRLGLSRDWIRNTVRDFGLELGQSSLSRETDRSHQFQRGYPQLLEFAETKRGLNPLPSADQLSPLDAAIVRILKPRILNSGNVPCPGHFCAAVLSAPAYLLPLVMETKRQPHRHPVFLTTDELSEWRSASASGDSDDCWSWCSYQYWNAVLKVSPDEFWLPDFPRDLTQLFVTWGTTWGPLQGHGEEELWGISSAGEETFVKRMGSWIT